MKLSQLAAKPQLIKITLDDEDTKTNYGDELEFFIYDRQDMDSFVKLATLDINQFDKLAGTVNDMILNEDGSKVVRDGLALPTDVMMKAIQKVIEVMGKPQVSTLTKPDQK